MQRRSGGSFVAARLTRFRRVVAGLTLAMMAVATPASAQVVVTYHSARALRGERDTPPGIQATEAGTRLLEAGGNATDAFVAATLAEYVVAEGGTSLAGTLGALVFDARTNRVEYVDADYNQVLNPNSTWTWWDTIVHAFWRDRSGKAVLVPGALGGLEALSRKHGRLGFARALEPAIQIAEQGFPVSEFYAALIAWSSGILKRSEYGRRTFFRADGSPLRPGDTLKQPELASFLRAVARDGAAYMYTGEWARGCVRAVQETGGLMTEEDLRRWTPVWREPWKITYRGYDLYAPSGRQYGGIWVDLALRALEHADLKAMGHFSRRADPLELVLQTARHAWAERTWFEDPARLDDRQFVADKLASAPAEIWHRVRDRQLANPLPTTGTHSYHIIVADSDGNVVSGTNSIQSLPWGAGTFVQGVPLNQTGLLPSRTGPGERVVNAFSLHLAFRDGQFRFATGAFTNALVETNLQFLLNLIDYRLPPAEAVSLPRFGTFPHDLKGWVDTKSNWLDPNVDASIADTLRARGLRVVQSGPLVGTGLDTGLGLVLARQDDGTFMGAAAPWPGLTAPWQPGTTPVKPRK
jgi:gamma-glutamyltranspeptidase/glutathione hydrolase